MYTANNILAEQEYKDLQVKHLVRSDTYEVLSISLEEGCLFPEHISPRDCSLLVLEGEIVLSVDTNEYKLHRHQVFDFKANVPHHVKALVNSKFLIIR
ncbi:MAG: cupin domain-containing protein [Flavobacteriaceae bacterium]